MLLSCKSSLVRIGKEESMIQGRTEPNCGDADQKVQSEPCDRLVDEFETIQDFQAFNKRGFQWRDF